MAGGPEIVFSVKNNVPSDSGITKDTLQDLMETFLTPGKSNSARKNKQPAEQGSLRVKRVATSTSTQAGLPHIHLACQGAGGSFNLKLDDDGRVVCAITLPAQLTSRRSQEYHRGSPGDDSSIGPFQRLKRTAKRSFSGDALKEFFGQNKGSSSEDHDTPCAQPEMPESLKILAIDDSSVGSLCVSLGSSIFSTLICHKLTIHFCGLFMFERPDFVQRIF
jgi:hypothetical protein